MLQTEVEPEHPKLSIKRLVKTDIRIVEPMQMEASFEHRLMVKQGQQVVYPKRYKVESYFVFPPQMKVNKSTYRVDNFYRDMKSYFNFRIPKLSYKEMMGLTDDPERSPLRKILAEISDEDRPFNPQRQSFIEDEARIFACSFFTFLKRKVKRMQAILNELSASQMPDESLRLLDEAERAFRDTLVKVFNIYREWQKVSREVATRVSGLQTEIHSIDEYLIMNIKDVVLELDLILQRHGLWPDLRDRWRQRLRAILRMMRMYSKREKFIWVDSRSPSMELEQYFYRRGLLKRRIWSALYLDTRTKPLFFLQQQTSAVVAAGLAGAWAVLADVVLRLQSGRSNMSMESIGLSSFLLGTALIVAYIIRDRIKDVANGMFKGGIFGNMPDNSSKIVYEGNAAEGETIHVGNQEEKVSIKDSTKLPDDITALLEAESVTSLENEACTVIRYQKILDLRGERTRVLKRKIRAIYTFYRLNVGAFLSPLDAPFAEHLLPNSKWEAGLHMLPKVYHIDLIIRVSGDDETVKDVYYHYYQLIVDKEGIRRIDKVLLPGDTEDEPVTEMA
jgi:hypothetical protein